MVAVAAVDCGATSVRVCRVDLEHEPAAAEVVLRVRHRPYRDGRGHLRWDWPTIVAAVVEGLEQCSALGPLDSIGVDTWAVDYGLLDENGALIADPFSYRDDRTGNYLDVVGTLGGPAQLYGTNGLQLQPFNTLFQIAAHDRNELRRATRLLWLPELLVHTLTGVAVHERTSAGSSGLVDLRTGSWSPELLEPIGLDAGLLGPILDPGVVVGEWRGVPVSLVAGHDTASAVVATGAVSSANPIFVATGSWILAGIERRRPDTSEWARERNFTNEAAAFGGYRFLRNVTGFWLLEQCRTSWADRSIEELVRAAEAIPTAPIVDVNRSELAAPDDMLGAYTEQAGLARDADPAIVTRSIVDSVAASTAAVISDLGDVASASDVVLVGGAARMDLFRRQLETATGRLVRAGPAEAAAIGNALVQGVAIGEIDRRAVDRLGVTSRQEA